MLSLSFLGGARIADDNNSAVNYRRSNNGGAHARIAKIVAFPSLACRRLWGWAGEITIVALPRLASMQPKLSAGAHTHTPCKEPEKSCKQCRHTTTREKAAAI